MFSNVICRWSRHLLDRSWLLIAAKLLSKTIHALTKMWPKLKCFYSQLFIKEHGQPKINYWGWKQRPLIGDAVDWRLKTSGKYCCAKYFICRRYTPSALFWSECWYRFHMLQRLKVAIRTAVIYRAQHIVLHGREVAIIDALYLLRLR